MENAPQPKKINWGMIIALVVLIPLLLLGYKFISKKMDEPANNTSLNNPSTPNGANSSTAQNGDFPAGTWYRNDPTINSKYIFDVPQMVNNVQQGQLDMIMDDRSEGKVNYEVIGNGKLRISDPQGSFNPWELGYSYNAAGQSLEIISSGNSATYTRNPVYVATNNTPATVSAAPAPVNNNNNVNTSQLPPVGFDNKNTKPADLSGTWSNAHGAGSDKYTMTLEFQQAGSSIDGFIYNEQYDHTGHLMSDIQWNIGGTINGNVANITIRDDKGRNVSTGTLVKNGNNLAFSMANSNPNLPKSAKLTGR